MFSGPYFHVFGLNTEIYHIQSKHRKIRTRKNSIFGHFSRSVGDESVRFSEETFVTLATFSDLLVKLEISFLLTLPVPIPDEDKNIKLNFHFHTSLWCLKSFYEDLKGFHKPLEAPQRSVKIKIGR